MKLDQKYGMNNKITSMTIGEISINIAEHKLTNQSGKTNTLQPKVIEVLAFIASHYPRLISRNELIESIWEGNYHVGEKALTNSIWVLRQSFKKLCPDIEIIETVRKSGYKVLLEPKIDYSENTQASVIVSPTPINKMAILFFAILLASLALSYQFWPVRGTSREAVSEELNITREPGSEVFPSISPDGRFLAFKWVRPGYPTDLFIKELAQPDSLYKQVTFDEETETGPVWSRDSTNLFYLKKNQQTLTCDLVRLNLQTNETKRLAACPYSGFPQIDISSDGKYVAYRGQPESGGKSSVYLLNIFDENGLPQRLTCIPNCDYNDRDIAFSPDGKKLAVSRRSDDFHENIVIVDIESKSEVHLTERFEDINGLTWHPNGEHIVFGAQRADLRQGLIINVKDGEFHDLNVAGFSFPRFSSSGDLYYHKKIEKYQISSLDFSKPGSPVVLPVLLSSYSHKNPDYSDASGKLVYVSNESGDYELWLANKDGTSRRQLTHLNSEVNYPSWSHDGRYIVFTAPKADGYGDELNIIDVVSGNIKKINSKYSDLGRPSWSFDDEYIFSVVYLPDQSEIFAFGLNGDDSFQFTKNNGRYAQSINQKEVYYSTYRGGLWVKSTNGDDKDVEILSRSDFGIKYVWDLTDNGIFFYHSDKHNHRINFYDLNSKKPKSIFDFAWLRDDQYGSLSVSLSNKLLFLTVSEYPQADIKLLTHPLLN